eukprot:NODE_1521_length_1309_cov_1.384941_g1508_i0.p2 GENE.NODE_1521_length_1309_cov_1.384941_g1508_i0~~NODE_1521_length_1309_cov_1.384941_g1508_i0.p2  ORF type:complete len:242 (+),score=34.14 NODE_1521_length_1309_cov_1.384941_g1508_i0:353-1078(+)
MAHGHLAHFGPVQKFKLAILVFDKGGAAFDPVSVIAIKHITDHAFFGMMDMTANHAIDLALGGFVGDGIFEIADELNGVFDPVFKIGRKRPVTVSKAAANAVIVTVKGDGQVVGRVPKIGQPSGIFDNPVKFIAMNDQQAFAIGCFVDIVHFDIDMPKGHIDKFTGKFIMVSGDKDDFGAIFCLIHDCRDNSMVTFRPIPAFLEPPAVNNVTDQIIGICCYFIEEIQKKICLTSTCPQMDV